MIYPTDSVIQPLNNWGQVLSHPDIAEYLVPGYAWAEDKEHCEEYGRMLQADPDKVSPRAKKRGLPQVYEPPS